MPCTRRRVIISHAILKAWGQFCWPQMPIAILSDMQGGNADVEVVRLVKKGGGSVTFGFFLPPLIFSLAGLDIHTVL